MLVPFYFSFVRCERTGHDIHERTFALAIRTDQPDMLTRQQAERYIIKDCTVTKTVR